MIIFTSLSLYALEMSQVTFWIGILMDIRTDLEVWKRDRYCPVGNE
jgi:hypothetical protein